MNIRRDHLRWTSEHQIGWSHSLRPPGRLLRPGERKTAKDTTGSKHRSDPAKLANQRAPAMGRGPDGRERSHRQRW